MQSLLASAHSLNLRKNT